VIGRSPWWDKGVHADRRPLLMARGRIRDAARSYFGEQEFIEVECGALQLSPGNEAHLHAFAADRIAPDGERRRYYLHTSPEFACKKLLAAGERKIFTLAPVYRNREHGDLNASEFTMLEWYRAEENYGAVIEDALRIVRAAAKAAGCTAFEFRGKEADPFAAPAHITVADAFREFADIDLMATLGPRDATDRDALARQAAAAGITIAANDCWSDIFSRIQLYLCGVELANGFGELTDADEQRRRFEREMDEKQRIHGERYPIDEGFLAALAHMPPASGVALGFDRLVMLATNAGRIDRVMWTPLEE
jgi:lysyl-tRNA synthetase class 2